MAWARLVTYPGGTEEQYRAIQDALGDAHEHAEGRLFLTAGPSERGWQIFMVWESAQAFFAWARRYVGRAHERAGDRGWSSDPEMLDFETFHVLR
jgi:heme-degrading monooxygenase HmoA